MTPADRLRAAIRLYSGRRMRDVVFTDDPMTFGEPAWDMLLGLYVQDGARPVRTSNDVLALAADEAERSQRYLEWLVARDLVDRVDGKTEGPLYRLAKRGRALLDDYLDREAALANDLAANSRQ